MPSSQPYSSLPPLLLPVPRTLRLTGGVVGVGVDPDTIGRLDGGGLRHPQSYKLVIGPGAGTGSADLAVASEAGLRYGRATLRQLIRQYGRAIPAMVIEDAPAFRTRGVMLDASRDRVPTMPFLQGAIETFASLKLNHLQLYTEHTFAYAGHEGVWRGASPVTPDEARTLDAHARALGVDLAPNQNCFGHLHRWLARPEYEHLAETLGEWTFMRWERHGPFSLCPVEPAAEAFVRDLLAQLLPCFGSGLVNIGCDETFDVGQGRSETAVKERGRAAVYFEFAARVCAIARELGKRPMMWADIALSAPESLGLFPKEAIGLAWGYEPDFDFGEACRRLAEQGVESWVCPGTSAWLSITGRTTERRGNLAKAAAARRDGATGFLLTDWGDFGHMQQWPVTMHAIGEGAQQAWNPDATPDPRAISLHALGDTSADLSLASWLDELGDVDLAVRQVAGMTAEGKPAQGPIRNSSALFIDLHRPTPYTHPVGAPIEAWRGMLDHLVALERSFPAQREPAGLLEREVRQTLAHAKLAALHGVVSRDDGPVDRARATEMVELAREVSDGHMRLWGERSRPGGLPESMARFEMLRRRLAGERGVGSVGLLGL